MRVPVKSKEEILNDLTKVFRKNGLSTTISQLVEACGCTKSQFILLFSQGKTTYV